MLENGVESVIYMLIVFVMLQRPFSLCFSEPSLCFLFLCFPEPRAARRFLLAILTFFLVGMGVGYGQGYSPPFADVSTTGALCNLPNGKIAVTLTGQAPFVVTLSGGAPAVSQSVTTNSTTAVFDNLFGSNSIYTVTATDANGVSSSVYPEVGNIPPPTVVSALATTPASCLNNDGVVTVTLAPGVGTPNFSLSVGGQAPVTSGGNVLVATGVASGTPAYTVKDANGCVVPGTVTVPLNDNLTLSTSDATICQGSSTRLAVASNASSYAWSPASGLSSVSVAEPVASPSSSTTYNLSATLGICTLTRAVAVTVLPAPVADAGGPTDTTCYGKSIQLQGSGGVQYTWSPATGLSSTTIADPIVELPMANVTYSLSVVGADGCASVAVSKVTVIVRSPYKVFAGDDTSVAVGQSVPFSAVDVQGVGFSQYAWTPATGLSNPDIADPVASFSAEGTYTYILTATGPEGCEARDSITVKVYGLTGIFVPGAFTPNNDGHNDVLRILPVGMQSLRYFSVFDRWGQQVFTTTNLGIGWDGTFNGHEMPAGVYVWMAGGVDDAGKPVERKGTVVLIR